MHSLMQLTASSATLSMCGNDIEQGKVLCLSFPFQRNTFFHQLMLGIQCSLTKLVVHPYELQVIVDGIGELPPIVLPKQICLQAVRYETRVDGG